MLYPTNPSLASFLTSSPKISLPAIFATQTAHPKPAKTKAIEFSTLMTFRAITSESSTKWMRSEHEMCMGNKSILIRPGSNSSSLVFQKTKVHSAKKQWRAINLKKKRSKKWDWREWINGLSCRHMAWRNSSHLGVKFVKRLRIESSTGNVSCQRTILAKFKLIYYWCDNINTWLLLHILCQFWL